MRKIAITSAAVATVALLALSGCSTSRDAGTGTGTTTGSAAAAGFAAGSSIGIALPDKTSENWTIAGQLFTDAITKAGFKPDVQYAGSTSPVPDQQSQISTMIQNGDKVIVIGANDSKQLGAQVKAAHDAGITIIAYDRLIENTANVDYYAAFNNYKVGQLQGQALIDGLKASSKPAGPWNIELFSGAATDPNAAVFFNGAMSVLQPLIDSKQLVVGSGEVSVQATATVGWDPAKAQTRMDTILQSTYQSKSIDGVLSPNDTLARAIIKSVSDAKKPGIVITGQDSEAASIPYIMDGRQYMTIYKDTRKLVDQTLTMIGELSKGGKATTNDKANNGSVDVPTFYLDPVVVTKANAADVYKDNATLFPLTQK